MLMHLLEHPRTTTVTNHHCTSSTSSALHFKTTPSVLLTTIFLRLYAGMFHYETETVLTGMKNFPFSSGKTSKLLSEHFSAIAVKDVLLWGFFCSQGSASVWVSDTHGSRGKLCPLHHIWGSTLTSGHIPCTCCWSTSGQLLTALTFL